MVERQLVSSGFHVVYDVTDEHRIIGHTVTRGQDFIALPLRTTMPTSWHTTYTLTHTHTHTHNCVKVTPALQVNR